MIWNKNLINNLNISQKLGLEIRIKMKRKINIENN